MPACVSSSNACERCNGTRCQLYRHVCLINGTIYHRESRAQQWRLLQSKIRIPWNSHHQLEYSDLNTGPALGSGLGALLDDVMHQKEADTSCSPPLAWVPVWSVNYADSIYSSVIPLLELSQHDIVRWNHTLLIADTLQKHMHPRCRSNTNGPCATPSWFGDLISQISQMCARINPLHDCTFMLHSCPLMLPQLLLFCW